MYNFDGFAQVHSKIIATGILKSADDDFKVEEIMPIEPTGDGEHLWLWVEKRGCNTEWVARVLAQKVGIKLNAISYAGLKDRHAVTRQWFSLHLPGIDDPDFSEPRFEDLREQGIAILDLGRHRLKLKRGTLEGNRFDITLRELTADKAELEQRLESLVDTGVPNYFGKQRFGFNMGNLPKAELMFAGKARRLKKHQRSLYLSAARSWIFNQILSKRIENNCWDKHIKGDVLMLAGKSACFKDDGSADIELRINQHQLHPTTAMWGDGESMAADDCAILEQQVADENPLLNEGLIAARLKHERRSNRILLNDLNWDITADSLNLRFELPAGAYATMVLREIGDFIESDRLYKK